MKTHRFYPFIVLILTLNATVAALAQGTAFTYHGRLANSGSPANGSYDLVFSVFDAEAGNNQIGSSITNTSLLVTDGIFVTSLDFSAGVFTGPARWLEIGVRTNGTAIFTILSPRRMITAAPYAIMANSASNLLGALPASQLTGTAAIDITGNAAHATTADSATTATSATSATTAATAASVPWSGLTGAPVGFADGVDNDTLFTAGTGLNLIGTQFSVRFGGNGTENFAARSDHNHDATYSLLGHQHAATDLTSGTLADERLSSNVALLNGNQTFSSSNTFNGVLRATNTDNTLVGSFSGNGSGLSNTVVQAGRIIGPLPANTLQGVYTNAVNFNNPANSFSGSFAGNGADLENVDAISLGGRIAADFWQLGGNAGTLAGANFLGTLDNQPLELKVNSTRALRLEPNTNGAPNVIGGAPLNVVADGIVGAAIGGGGATDYGGLSFINEVASDFGTIAGGYNNLIWTNSSGSTIAGGGSNSVSPILIYSISRPSPNATIGGGYLNTVVGPNSTVAGGNSNFVGSDDSTVGGGNRNLIAFGLLGGVYAQFGGYGSAISGGISNSIMHGAGPYGGGLCTISGGYSNIVGTGGSMALGHFVGGGVGHKIGGNTTYCTISGGYQNTMNTDSKTCAMGGGSGNYIDSSSATIAGGSGNRIQNYSPIGYGYGDAIGGGSGNLISYGGYATISGGYYNTNKGRYATIPGGNLNYVGGTASFAAGQYANVTNNNSIVWSDGSTNTYSTTNYQFLARASGGVIFYSGTDTSSGVELPAGGGAWSSLSDRNAKENFVPVNPRAVLEQLSRLSVETWNYKGQDKATRHIGPIAQDFAAAFQVGENNKRISTVDADGVALAAIKGLNEIVQEQQTQLKQKEAEIQSLQQRLEVLERAVLGKQVAQSGGAQ